MEESVCIDINSNSNIIVAREIGRKLGREIGFPSTDLTIIATVISEVARNIIVFAKDGRILIRKIKGSARSGIEIIAEDNGPGIPDIFLAMQDGYSTGKGLGLGLPGVRRLSDEFEIFSENGKGTKVIMKKWLI
jgi:serine/threonine-protein kinase RsbT